MTTKNEIINITKHLGSQSNSWRALAQSSTAKAREIIPYHFAISEKILPVAIRKNSHQTEILLAAQSGINQIEVTSKLKLITNLVVKVIECSEPSIEKAIRSAYFKNLEEIAPPKFVHDLKNKSNLNVRNIDLNEAHNSKTKEIPKLLNNILNSAYANQASDVHIESKKNFRAYISLRTSGKLTTLENYILNSIQFESLIRYIKVICNLDITEHQKPLEGMFEVKLHESDIRIRVSIIPSIYGTKIALRILHHYLLDELEKSPENYLSELGLSNEQEQIFSQKLNAKNGLVLVSGPTGSGKSTLLYSLINQIVPADWNILSLEDPVEREIPHITQIEVKSENQDSFYTALKSLLRQDPDMIMISEIRDSKVLETAIQAALSGILVASTIHASKTLELILRMFELGSTPVTLGSVLKLTSSQRLIPTNCPTCLELIFDDNITRDLLSIPRDFPLAKSSGCTQCNFTKSAGQIAVYETCIPNLALVSEIYQAFKDGMNAEIMYSIQNQFNKTHFSPFQKSIRNLLISKQIPPETAMQFLN